MNFIATDILPLGLSENQKTIADTILSEAEKSDELRIAVGYVSEASLRELDQILENTNLQKIQLALGMYYVEGMPERSYRTALKLNEKWTANQTGEIRAVKPFKYHGKIFCFYKDGQPRAAVMGSANLGILKPDANNRRQYELAAIITSPEDLKEFSEHVSSVLAPPISENIAEIEKFPLIREMNTALSGVELVSKIPMTNVDFYKKCHPVLEIDLPLKVPTFEERFLDDGRHYTKSNINVAYAAPRSKRKSRDWYEAQLTVSKEITRTEGYPEKNKPFFIVTDDGYWFKAHTTSDGNKQFSAVGDELIMGRWIKGRLAAAGIVSHVNDTQQDTARKGMITKEMLDEYGCQYLSLKKTGQTALDEKGDPFDVWLLSFERGEVK